MSKPSQITVSCSKRGTTIKASGRSAQALFDALTGKGDTPVPRLSLGPCTVFFEDHGQDFLEWDVDARRRVTASRPAQNKAWVGQRLVALPRPGAQLLIRGRDGLQRAIKYPVLRVVHAVAHAAAGKLTG